MEDELREGRTFSADQPAAARVLVVEDEDLAASALGECLEEQGFAVILARDGVAALEAAEGGGFDVLLTDLRMPRLDGSELIRRLRAERPSLPVIVMTGQVPCDWQQELQREGEGPMRLLYKPATLRSIVETVRGVLMPGAAATLPN